MAASLRLPVFRTIRSTMDISASDLDNPLASSASALSMVLPMFFMQILGCKMISWCYNLLNYSRFLCYAHAVNWSKALTKLLYALVGYIRHSGIRSSNSGTAQKNVLIASMICWASSLPSGDKQPNLVSRETRPTARVRFNKLINKVTSRQLINFISTIVSLLGTPINCTVHFTLSKKN